MTDQFRRFLGTDSVAQTRVNELAQHWAEETGLSFSAAFDEVSLLFNSVMEYRIEEEP